MLYAYSLDALNCFLVDVRQGLGPYFAVYLLTDRNWTEDKIGMVMSIATVSGLVMQDPAGALIDISRSKRAIICAAAFIVTGASIILPFMSSFFLVAGSQAAAGAVEAFLGLRLLRSAWGSWAYERSRAELAAMKASIMLATRLRRGLQALVLGGGGPATVF